MKRLFTVCLIVFVCALLNVEGNIGSTLRESQRTYGSRGAYTSDNRGVEWNIKGWTVTEYYDSEGYCDDITYLKSEVGFISESTFLNILRMNTPSGVVWKEQSTGPWTGISRIWNSTEYIKNGLISDHLVAKCLPIFPQDAAPNSVITPRFYIRIATVSGDDAKKLRDLLLQ